MGATKSLQGSVLYDADGNEVAVVEDSNGAFRLLSQTVIADEDGNSAVLADGADASDAVGAITLGVDSNKVARTVPVEDFHPGRALQVQDNQQTNLLREVLRELRILNRHMSEITGENGDAD